MVGEICAAAADSVPNFYLFVTVSLNTFVIDSKNAHHPNDETTGYVFDLIPETC